jgi:hypothetical protein
MMIEVSTSERDLLAKVLETHLSELRQEIAATKRDTSALHAEENVINDLQAKLARDGGPT